MAMLRQKAKTLDRELVDVMNDVSKLFPAGTMVEVPAEFKNLLYKYLITLENVKKINSAFITGNTSAVSTKSEPSKQPTTTPANTSQSKSTTQGTVTQPQNKPQQTSSAKQAISIDGKKYAVDSKGKVRVTVGGKRTYFQPIEYQGTLFVPLVKDRTTGEIKQVEKKGDKLYVKGTNIEVGPKSLKEIQEIINF